MRIIEHQFPLYPHLIKTEGSAAVQQAEKEREEAGKNKGKESQRGK